MFWINRLWGIITRQLCDSTVNSSDVLNIREAHIKV